MQRLKSLYVEQQAEVLPLIPGLGVSDTRAIEYVGALHDFYFGRFF